MGLGVRDLWFARGNLVLVRLRAYGWTEEHLCLKRKEQRRELPGIAWGRFEC